MGIEKCNFKLYYTMHIYTHVKIVYQLQKSDLTYTSIYNYFDSLQNFRAQISSRAKPCVDLCFLDYPAIHLL